MFDSIFIGTSGLQTFQSGLKVISNNVANLNTPGFKSSDAVFSNLYYGNSSDGVGQHPGSNQQFGTGVHLGQTVMNFQAGEARQTGNPLDLSVAGDGFFVTRHENGDVTFTRAGQFEFNKDGILVLRGTQEQVLGLGPNGEQRSISLSGLRINAPKSTTTVTLAGNLSSSATTFSLSSVNVTDAVGGQHTLAVNMTPQTATPGTWDVKVMDGTTQVATGQIMFIGGVPVAGSDSLTFSYAPSGVAATSIKLDFGSEVTSFEAGTTSTLAVKRTDGYAVGSLSSVSFDTDGTMVLAYSNGQTVKGDRIALAAVERMADLIPQGASEFKLSSKEGVRIGVAGQNGIGSLTANQVEGSNVDLASEFSDLIVTQRGYQASSRIISTANDMLQELFDMKGHQ